MHIDSGLNTVSSMYRQQKGNNMKAPVSAENTFYTAETPKVFSTYYFQSVLQTKISLLVSLMRGIVISGIMVIILPMIWNPGAIWYSMVITETIVAVYVVNKMKTKI